MELTLLQFILANKNWEKSLQEAPYSLKIKRDGEFIMFSYNQIDSNFRLQIVREARGIIFHEPTWTPVCVPFFKFGNYGESYAADIEWESARVVQKLDGSLIKVWFYNGEWRVSTNGTIDASKAPLSFSIGSVETFFDLFYQAAVAQLNFAYLNRRYTYMFELVSPLNKIVVPYSKTEIYHIGTRDNVTLEELDVYIGVKKPESYDLADLAEVLDSASALPFNEEGYVVVDKNWNRIKVKSPAYVAVHHLRGEGAITNKRIIKLVLLNEHEELLAYYPEYSDAVSLVCETIENFVEDAETYVSFALENDWSEGGTLDSRESRKSLADFARATKYQDVIFSIVDKKSTTVAEWLRSLPTDKLLSRLELQ